MTARFAPMSVRKGCGLVPELKDLNRKTGKAWEAYTSLKRNCAPIRHGHILAS